MGVGWWAKIYLACLGVAVLVLSVYPPEDTYVYDIYPTTEVHTVEKVVETVCLDELPICVDVEEEKAPIKYDFTMVDVTNITKSYVAPVTNQIASVETTVNANAVDIANIKARMEKEEAERFNTDKKIILGITSFVLLGAIVYLVRYYVRKRRALFG